MSPEKGYRDITFTIYPIGSAKCISAFVPDECARAQPRRNPACVSSLHVYAMLRELYLELYKIILCHYFYQSRIIFLSPNL